MHDISKGDTEYQALCGEDALSSLSIKSSQLKLKMLFFFFFNQKISKI